MSVILKSIFLFIFFSTPFFLQAQLVSLDELINMQKIVPTELNNIQTKISSYKLELIQSINETSEDWGRVVWKLNDDTQVTVFFSKHNPNRVLFQTNKDDDKDIISQMIFTYKMNLLDEKNEKETNTKYFIGVNYVIIYTTELYLKPSKTIEIYKKEDFFSHRKEIEDAHKKLIGDSYLGGIIFELDETGKHGYVVTPFDIASNMSIGDAVNAMTTFLFDKEKGIYNDEPSSYWRFAPADVMYKIYLNLSKSGLVVFEDKFFWTSDLNIDGGYAKVLNLKTGENKTVLINSNSKYSIILIRNF